MVTLLTVENQPLDATTLVSRRPSVLSERVLDETVVMAADDDVYVRLNASGRWLWDRLSEPRSVGALAQSMAQEFGIKEPLAVADVTAFVHELASRRLVELRR
jgi:hypothetical protein